ncbi:hypothetical protein AB0D10_32355 [Kitasatospora sp. NPDC048545]
MPNRGYPLFRPLTGPQPAGAVDDLVSPAVRVHSENPGPLSPRLCW